MTAEFGADENEEHRLVGRFPANPFGLYDMHGNIWEWCADPWHENYANAPVDGSVWEVDEDEPNDRVLRGGSFEDKPGGCRSASRMSLDPLEYESFYGFRVVCSI